MEIEFFGAAGEVTGSCHIVRVGGKRFLLDCGLIQGRREDIERNRQPFPFDPKSLDCVVLSHAHLDHSGRLPLLVKQGFRGPIYCQNATADLCEVLLEDAARLGEYDAKRQNRRLAKKKKPQIEPLYRDKDVQKVLKLLVGNRYRTKREILPGVTIQFRDAGHIMGSTSVEVWLEEDDKKRKVVFSGDVGQYDSPILNDPEVIKQADVVLMESTYGNRLHRDREETVQEIGEIISEARHNKGNILIPAFAIGRSQEILYMLGKHYDEWDLDRWHVFLDSPMAIEASKIYWEYPHLYDEEATRMRRAFNEMPKLRNLHLSRTADDSKSINKLRSGAIIIAGSGMCTGGRIVHHLRHNLGRRENHVIIVGYQAVGTLGRRLVDGADMVKIYGEEVRVNAHIDTVGGLSAHGDWKDLGRWVSNFESKPDVWLVHGEKEASAAFEKTLRKQYRINARVAQAGNTISL
ncbi:MAG: MBL fold metallo-hydrolase [Gammaproteobacteria bacterium]|nr:MAG: MBL fold metallo-hydrolase [Gammaproteobacteria bacterium]